MKPLARRSLPLLELGADDDKYAIQNLPGIDCASRLALCRARCCRFSFALSPQDVAEGIVQWDAAQPYVVARRDDGACVHLAADRCAIHGSRPSPCRRYDCRGDDRIWIDFELRIPRDQRAT